MTQKRTIAHIINPVNVPPDSDLYQAQVITFETMRRARVFASDKVDVIQYTTQYAEDHPIIPDDFVILPDLIRSVLDFGTFENPRKLPLIKDILDRVYEESDAEYFVYTNVDIALMPFFYETVEAYIQAGYDALVINRRVIPDKYTQVSDIPYMYSERGQRHSGFDCFVFKRSLYPKFRLGNTCIGAILFDVILLCNMLIHSDNYLYLPCKHLTFHIGDDAEWRKSHNQDYFQYNKTEATRALEAIDEEYGPLDQYPELQPYLNRLKTKHPFLLWANSLSYRMITWLRKKLCIDC